MGPGEVLERKQVDGNDGKACMTRLEFCSRNRISESFYHKLKKLGLGPVEMRVLNKTLITFEAESAWQVARQGKVA